MKTRLPILMLALAAILPAQDRNALPLPAPGNVTLPLDEYNKLLDLASKQPKKPEAPPLPFAIKRAEMNAQVNGVLAWAKVQLEGETYAKGIVKVPLVTRMTVLDAQQKGAPLPIQQDGDVHSAALPGPGEFAVSLDTGLRVSIDAGQAQLLFTAPAASSSRLTLTVPGESPTMTINPGLITSRTSANGRTVIEAALKPGAVTVVWWATREAAAPPAPKEVRFLSEVKTAVAVREAEIAVAALVDVTVVQGEPAQFEAALPAGWEVTGVTGATMESADVKPGAVTIKVKAANQRNHQFLISLERPITETKAETPLVSLRSSQRETGEVIVEGEGTMELTAKESGGLKRIDAKEINPLLLGLARNPLQASFRYHRRATEQPALALEWVRFPDSSVLSAVAQQAVVTTLVTSEGKSLTEVKLTLRNQAKPFLRVALPQGASILSADVAGEKVKLVQGQDGSRVPLLRAGFRPTGPYTVSFVLLHSGAPFAKKGGSELSLPRMDIPVGLVEWEVFLPERYKVAEFGGDATSARLLPPPTDNPAADEEIAPAGPVDLDGMLPGQVGGYVTDEPGAVVPNAQVVVTHSPTGATFRSRTDPAGRWILFGVPSGELQIVIDAPGFRKLSRRVHYDASRPMRYNYNLEIGAVTETVTVTAEQADLRTSQRIERDARKQAVQLDNTASANVTQFQQKVAGVLPVAVDVPRAGASYRFVRPLVLDEETRLTFTYRTR